jgi:hypothetical protein
VTEGRARAIDEHAGTTPDDGGRRREGVEHPATGRVGRGVVVATDRCAAITRAGARCKLVATHDAYCYQHSPQTVAERKRNGRRGGRAGGNGRPSAGGEVERIKSALWALTDRVSAGEQPGAATLVQAYHCLLRCVEVERRLREQDELLERLERLEAELDEASEASEAGRRTA